MTFSSRKFSSAVFFLMCICMCPCGFDVHHLPEARKWSEVPGCFEMPEGGIGNSAQGPLKERRGFFLSL